MGNDMNDPFSNMTQMWLQMAANAAQAWQPAAGSTASPEMFRKGRADLMQIWSDWCEQLMRSSAFLEAQKQCMGGSLAVRKQVRANLRQVQRELQLAGREDIDTLTVAIRRSQRRVLDQLEETSERMRALESKLDCLGQRLERVLNDRASDNRTSDDRASEEDGDVGHANGEGNGSGNGNSKKKKRHEARD